MYGKYCNPRAHARRALIILIVISKMVMHVTTQMRSNANANPSQYRDVSERAPTRHGRVPPNAANLNLNYYTLLVYILGAQGSLCACVPAPIQTKTDHEQQFYLVYTCRFIERYFPCGSVYTIGNNTSMDS